MLAFLMSCAGDPAVVDTSPTDTATTGDSNDSSATGDGPYLAFVGDCDGVALDLSCVPGDEGAFFGNPLEGVQTATCNEPEASFSVYLDHAVVGSYDLTAESGTAGGGTFTLVCTGTGANNLPGYTGSGNLTISTFDTTGSSGTFDAAFLETVYGNVTANAVGGWVFAF